MHETNRGTSEVRDPSAAQPVAAAAGNAPKNQHRKRRRTAATAHGGNGGHTLEARLRAHYHRARETPCDAEMAACAGTPHAPHMPHSPGGHTPSDRACAGAANPPAAAHADGHAGCASGSNPPSAARAGSGTGELARATARASERRERELLAAAMVAAARLAPVPLPSFPAFVATQARFIKPWMWAAHAALAACIVAVCLTGAPQPTCDLAVGAAAAGMAIAGLPSFLASKRTGVAEIEFASAFNCHSALLARMIALGCSEVLLLSASALALPTLAETDAFSAFTRTFGPYLLACAGCLTITRRCPAEAAIGSALAWSAIVLCVLMGFAALAPTRYGAFADGAWAVVCAASALWAARESRQLLADAARGLDQLLPELKRQRQPIVG